MKTRRSHRSLALPSLPTVSTVVVGIVGVLAASALAPTYLTKFGFAVFPIGCAAFIALIALFVVPVQVLPSVGLVLFCLLPARILPQEGPLAALPVATIVLAIWALRRLLRMHEPLADTALPTPAAFDTPVHTTRVPTTRGFGLALTARISGIGFVLWSALVLTHSVQTQTSAGWLISFTAGAILPLVITEARAEARLLRQTWLILAAAFGCYALGEALLGSNPLWGRLYAVLGVTDSQHWSVYRAEASFGHPLIAALFFAVAAVLATTRWLTNRSRWPLVVAVISGLALIATVSRGPLLALAVTMGLAYLGVIALRGDKRWSRVALLAVIGAAGIAVLLSNAAFRERNSSTEAAVSSQARDIGIWVAVQAAKASDWLGTGPGTSGITGRLFDSVVIENSLLQLLISVGIPGVILFLGMIGCAVLAAFRRGDIAAGAALVVFTACITSFNAIDALRPLHLLLGCLLVLCLNGNPPEERLSRDRKHGSVSHSVQAQPMPPSKAVSS